MPLALHLLGALLGCGGNDGPPPPGGDADADADSDVDLGCAESIDMLSGPVAMEAGQQEYLCVEHTASRGGFATKIALAVVDDPTAVHHVVLYRGEMGLSTCEGVTVTRTVVFGGGLGTEPLEMPDGVGLAIQEGDPFIVQVHAVNATDEPVSVNAGVAMCITDSVDVQADEMNFGLVLPDVPAIPDDGKEHAYEDTCVLAGERTVFAAWPHMHQIGSWISVSYGDALLAEVPDWDFGDQRLYFPDPVTATDATATVSCRYVNPPGNGEVPFGLFSEEEMCVAFLYYYPAGLRGCS